MNLEQVKENEILFSSCTNLKDIKNTVIIYVCVTQYFFLKYFSTSRVSFNIYKYVLNNYIWRIEEEKQDKKLSLFDLNKLHPWKNWTFFFEESQYFYITYSNVFKKFVQYNSLL